MQAFRAIGAAFLMAWALMPATSHAQAATGATQASPPPAATCPCPGVQHRHVWRRHRHFYAWHHRHWWPVPVAQREPPVRAYYNVPLPRTFDGEYSRMMTQRARYFWLVANGPVYEYDIMANAYIPVARGEAERVLAAAGVPR